MRRPSDRTVDRWRRFTRWLVASCVRRAERLLAAGKREGAARRLHLAARIATAGGSGYFAHPGVERMALALAETLPRAKSQPRRGGAHRRWLHVVSLAYDIGGHTAFLRRWIDNDQSGDSQTIVVTGSTTVPVALSEAVRHGGGKVTYLSSTGLLGRAEELRAASSDADVVVLHHHMWDIVPAIAFGVPDGPPVLVLNHADHTFWVGASVADVAVNLRPVGAALNRKYRSIDRNTALPIPLDPPPDAATKAALRGTTRQSLGIPADAIVFLTVGSDYKYLPIGELDFPSAAGRLLARCPEAYLIAVGPVANRPEWRASVRKSSPRMIVVGPRQDIAAYHAAADIYLEGFPFDSATALLEAALVGLPVVPVPATAPLPFSAHGGLKAALPQPASVADYLDDATRLAQSPALRRDRAASLNSAVTAACTGNAWRTHLASLGSSLPPEHRIYAVADAPLDAALDRFLTHFLIGKFRLPNVMRYVGALAHRILTGR